jgi:hypothetical protein
MLFLPAPLKLNLDRALELYLVRRERDALLPTSGSSREEEIVSAPSLSTTSAPRGLAQVDAAHDGMCFQPSQVKLCHSTPDLILMGKACLNSTNSFRSGLTGFQMR